MENRSKITKLGRVSSESVLKCTGKNWDQWVEILKKTGAESWTHQEIVAYLKKRHKLGPWWQQGVTTGFEIATGRRISGQNAKGEYSTTSTRTLHIVAKAAWTLIAQQPGPALWLKPLSDFVLKPGSVFECSGGVYGEVRTMKAGKKVRMTWQEEDWAKRSVVEIYVVPKTGKKSILVFQHDHLSDARTRSRMKLHWMKVLDEVVEYVSKS